MSATTFDVVCVGNAIVDVLAEVDEAFIVELGLDKGSMRLVEADVASAIYAAVTSSVERSGGSAGNTAAAVASLGGGASFIGRVADDALGASFIHDIRKAGVSYELSPAADGPPTAHCLILVTPDGERTMNTYLGASQNLTADDIDKDLVTRASITYLEGYLWDPPHAKDAFRVAMDAARNAHRKVAFALSDGFCVDRYRDEFAELLAGPVDIVFGNDVEARSMFQTDDLEAAISELGRLCEVAVITRGPEGSSIVTNGERVDVPAVPVEKVIDTTGAGDVFAAGFLYGLTHEYSPYQAASLAAACASETIAQIGARPERDLRDFLI
jgi:adenosine kinase